MLTTQCITLCQLVICYIISNYNYGQRTLKTPFNFTGERITSEYFLKGGDTGSIRVKEIGIQANPDKLERLGHKWEQENYHEIEVNIGDVGDVVGNDQLHQCEGFCATYIYVVLTSLTNLFVGSGGPSSGGFKRR